jgi:hypothetical protein
MSDPAINNASAPDSFLIQKAGGYRLRTIRLVSWAEFHTCTTSIFWGSLSHSSFSVSASGNFRLENQCDTK